MPVNPTTVNELLARLSSHLDGESGADSKRWHQLVENQFRLTQETTRQVAFSWARSVSENRQRLR